MISKRFLTAIICISMLLTCFSVIQAGAASDPYTKTVLTDYGDYYSCKTNFYNINENCKVLFAYYKDGEMLDVDIRTYDSSYEIFTADIDFETIKVIVVNNTDAIRPITSVEVINNEKTTEPTGFVITSMQYETITQNAGYAFVEYRENESDKVTKNFSFDTENGTIYLNGVKQISNLDTLLNRFYGTAEFFCKNEDCLYDYDTVYIKNYETMVVESVNATTKRIASKNSMSLTYANDYGTIDATLYDADGKEMAWEDLKEWDVVSYTKTYNTPTTKVIGYVMNRNVTGTVTCIMGDEYYIDGVPYSINEEYLIGYEFYLGDYCTFYIDIMGNIVWYQLRNVEEDKYAYVSEAKVITSFFDDALALRMFTADGYIDTYTLSDNVKYNGTRYGCYDMATNEIAAALSDTFIYYELDEDNRITVIKTPTIWSAVSKDTGFTIYGTEVEESNYADNTGSLITSNSRVYTTKDTKIFKIGASESEYRILTNAELFDGDILKKATFYNVDENLNVEYVLVKEGIVSSVGNDLTAAVGVSSGEGEISFYKNGELLTLPVNNYYFNKELPAFGSVYIPVVSDKNKVNTVKELTVITDSMVNMSDYAKLANLCYDNENYYVDNIVSVDGDTVTLEIEGNIAIPATANVYFVDGGVKTGNLEELSLDSEKDYVLFAQEIDGEVTNAVIYIDYTKYVEPTVITDDYGYVRKAMIVTEFEGYMQFRIFTSDGMFDTYKLADKIMFNGEKINSAQLATNEYIAKFTDCFIHFKRNNKNEIVSIDLSSGNEEALTQYGEEVEASVYSADNKTLTTSLSNVYVNEDTKIFIIGASESDYAICPCDRLYNGDALRNVTFYNVDTDGKAEVVLIKGGIVSIEAVNAPVSLAVSTGVALDDGGFEVKRLDAFGAYAPKIYYSDSDYMISAPASGSAYIPVFTFKNTVKDILKLTDVDPYSKTVALGADAIDFDDGKTTVRYYFDNIAIINGKRVTLADDTGLIVSDETNVYVVDGRYAIIKNRISFGNINWLEYDDVEQAFVDGGSPVTDYVFFGKEVNGIIEDVVLYINYEKAE